MLTSRNCFGCFTEFRWVLILSISSASVKPPVSQLPLDTTGIEHFTGLKSATRTASSVDIPVPNEFSCECE